MSTEFCSSNFFSKNGWRPFSPLLSAWSRAPEDFSSAPESADRCEALPSGSFGRFAGGISWDKGLFRASQRESPPAHILAPEGGSAPHPTPWPAQGYPWAGSWAAAAARQASSDSGSPQKSFPAVRGCRPTPGHNSWQPRFFPPLTARPAEKGVDAAY